MRVDDFDFVLPPSASRLLRRIRATARGCWWSAPTARLGAYVRDLPDFLSPGDALVVNDTRVIAAGSMAYA